MSAEVQFFRDVYSESKRLFCLSFSFFVTTEEKVKGSAKGSFLLLLDYVIQVVLNF